MKSEGQKKYYGQKNIMVRLSNLLSARLLLSHAPTGASKMLRATGHARMVRKIKSRDYAQANDLVGAIRTRKNCSTQAK